MTRNKGQRRRHFKNITPFAEWSQANQRFFQGFREWLQSCGYGSITVNQYSAVVRRAIGYLNKPHETIHPVKDLERVRIHFSQRDLSPHTQRDYGNVLSKLAGFLGEELGKPVVVQHVNWEYHLRGLPDGLCEQVREFTASQQRNWRTEDHFHRKVELVSALCIPLRWMAVASSLQTASDITPQLWFAYLDASLEDGYHVNTVNCRLSRLQSFLRFLEENSIPICQRMLLVQPLKTSPRLPRDVPVSEIRRLLEANEREAQAAQAIQRRNGDHGPRLDLPDVVQWSADVRSAPVADRRHHLREQTHSHRAVQGVQRPAGVHELCHPTGSASLAGRPKNAQTTLESRLFPSPPAAHPALLPGAAEIIQPTGWGQGHTSSTETFLCHAAVECGCACLECAIPVGA